ncbi:P-loop containing nucleoside triphosphate hydrolase protein [Daldinia caldariorum]|uniref:P-loop containing nucleoside triphosphate hydrolase protein n=1 Tax=Daldinia caldariorum TaxID=326644 RepID=UPI0020076679|nr:P-loop containing nucleoside triphosphate hydrolase protein [Daldinia caldariorum]KAI1473241.1 P-loop containing nucleoside triphosphate hydrolase protein [Daldinia caldariorum]
MSRHQAYRNYDYENDLDEYDGDEFGDEEEELSPEDQAQMNLATAQVRAALGLESSKVTTQQIQDALWHYYYDVDKSVTYLTAKYVAPSTRKKGGGESRARHVSFAGFFSDMPWLNIPKNRETTFIMPSRPRGGLLGGASPAGKVSKLQALAIARKKKADEKKSDEKQLQATTRNLSYLSTTSVQPESTKENLRPASEIQREATGLPGANVAKTIENKLQSELERAGPVPTHSPEPELTESLPAAVPFEEEAAAAAAPSPFAQALLGSIKRSTTSPPKTYPFPYINLTSSVTDAFSAPSPDDVVLAAQSQASSKKSVASTTKKKASAGKVEEITGGVKGLKIPDAPLPKSKNVDVLKEFERSKSKKNASFVVVGHVDAGKSTLMGRLLLDLNVVDQRTIQKYRKEAESIGKSSFALAWVLDQRSEERSRGVTIDIATNKFETENTSFTILDAPGHRDFIPNMIAGASQADFAILVVDATTGAFEAGLKGQTREHSLLLRSMGVSRVIVATNKLDAIGWSQERFDEISQQVSGFLSATGFQLRNISFVPVSGLHGDNIVKRSAEPAASWFSGRTLVEELENSEPMARALNKPLRLTISEVYRTTQSPVTVSGRIDAGSLQVGDALMIQPSGEKAYVKSLELDHEPVEWAVAGQNMVMHLSNIDPIHVRVGDIICDTKQPIDCVDTFTVKVLAFDILMPMQVDVHRGRLHGAGQILEISALLDKTRGTVLKKKPKIVKPASVARVVVKMSTKVPLEAGQRVVLRCGGETVAAGLLE